MPVVPSYFINQFIKNFNVSSEQISNEYNRVIKEHGDTDEIKTEFIFEAFSQLISQFKKELPKNVQYSHRIVLLYDQFIKELLAQKMNADSFVNDKDSFKQTNSLMPTTLPQEKPKEIIYKQYNLNTKYGRRKSREQTQQLYNQMMPTEKSQHNFYSIVILVVICLLMWLLLGTHGFLKWVNH